MLLALRCARRTFMPDMLRSTACGCGALRSAHEVIKRTRPG